MISRNMTPADALVFLRRKHDLIVRSTCDPDERTHLRKSWDRRFAAIEPMVKLPGLQKLDRALEKAVKSHVFDWDCEPLRKKLVEEFGLSQLTDDEIELAAVPRPTPDEVRLTPSGNRRPEIRRFRDVQGVEHSCIDVSAATVREYAQLYSDYSGKPVRLSSALAERRIPSELQPQMGEADESEVIAALRCYLEKILVLVLNETAGIVLKDTSVRAAARAAANQPMQATPVQIQRAAAAMNVDRFWQMVEAARQKSGDGMADPDILQAALERCAVAEILGFQLRLEECLAASYRLDLWAVAYLVKGGCSDDGFEYFRGWLIAQGRSYFEAALADPERAADHADGPEAECEAILGVGMRAVVCRSKKPMPCGLTPRPVRATGSDWKEEDLPRLYPRLAARFCWREG